MTLLGFSYHLMLRPGFELTSVELHQDPGLFEGSFTNRATAPWQLLNSKSGYRSYSDGKKVKIKFFLVLLTGWTKVIVFVVHLPLLLFMELLLGCSLDFISSSILSTCRIKILWKTWPISTGIIQPHASLKEHLRKLNPYSSDLGGTRLSVLV